MTSTDTHGAGLVERVANAIRVECEKFENPVTFYVEGEAEYRWEKDNPDKDFWSDAPKDMLDDDLRDWKIIALAALSPPSPDRDAVIREALKVRRDAENSGLSHPDIIEALGCFLFDETRGLLEQQ